MNSNPIASLSGIQKATAYYQEKIDISVLQEHRLTVPVGARTALVHFDSENATEGIMRYLETDDCLDVSQYGILADKGFIKELVGQEMFAFRARSADGNTHTLHITYTR